MCFALFPSLETKWRSPGISNKPQCRSRMCVCLCSALFIQSLSSLCLCKKSRKVLSCCTCPKSQKSIARIGVDLLLRYKDTRRVLESHPSIPTPLAAHPKSCPLFPYESKNARLLHDVLAAFFELQNSASMAAEVDYKFATLHFFVAPAPLSTTYFEKRANFLLRG
jgi:hypothetical protein